MLFSFGSANKKEKARKAEATQRKIKEASLMQEERKHILSSSSDFFMREAYKTLRTNISFALVDDEGGKVVLVTSSLQSEGKSITAVNLGISYAQMDRKVIIVDCDLRRPKLARLFKVVAPEGLSNLLMSRSKEASDMIVKTKIRNLDILPAGDIPPNPSELLSCPRMQSLLSELRKKYDLIVLDTPPINMVTDAVVLAPKSDGVLFVVRAGHSERGAVVHAVEQLEYTENKILGFILNGVALENTSYGYSKNRYRRYGYWAYLTRRYRRYDYGYSRQKGGYGYGYYGRKYSQEQKDNTK